VLCKSDGGTNETVDCVTQRQAQVINKIWYGMISNGSVPDPAVDNGWDSVPGGRRKWYGLQRGTSLYDRAFIEKFGVTNGLTVPGEPFTTGLHFLAVALRDPAIADPSFKNAVSNGKGGWKALDYEALGRAFEQGVQFNRDFGGVDTDNPDLSAFAKRGGKLLTWHGLSDEVIPPQGTTRYYRSIMDRMGGASAVQRFYRLYLVPGNGHGSQNGTANPACDPAGHRVAALLPAPDRLGGKGRRARSDRHQFARQGCSDQPVGLPLSRQTSLQGRRSQGRGKLRLRRLKQDRQYSGKWKWLTTTDRRLSPSSMSRPFSAAIPPA
jgi:hypothetical protein